jgi:hypothetical protein
MRVKIFWKFLYHVDKLWFSLKSAQWKPNIYCTHFLYLLRKNRWSNIHNNWLINLSFVKIGEVEAIFYWRTLINVSAYLAYTLSDLGVAVPCYLFIMLLIILELHVLWSWEGSNLLIMFLNTEGLGKRCLLHQSLHENVNFTDSCEIFYVFKVANQCNIQIKIYVQKSCKYSHRDF